MEITTFPEVFTTIEAPDECLEAHGARVLLLKTLYFSTRTVNLMAPLRNLSPSDGTPCFGGCAGDQDVQRYIEGRIPHPHPFVMGRPETSAAMFSPQQMALTLGTLSDFFGPQGQRG
jgi:hypothetical protein